MRAITADTALRLGQYFKMEPQFWLNIQSNYDLGVASGGVWSKIKSLFPNLCPTVPPQSFDGGVLDWQRGCVVKKRGTRLIYCRMIRQKNQ